MRICLGLLFVLATVIAGGCVTTQPTVMESGFQRKIITPCDNDVLCFRHSYDVTWDAGCREGGARSSSLCGAPSNGYPVSYRSNEYIFETGSYGYAITLPGGGAVRMLSENKDSK